MTVVRVFFKTNVTVSAVTVSVVKTNVFSTLEGTLVRIYAYLHYMGGLGLNFDGPGQKINGTDRAAIFRPVQGSDVAPRLFRKSYSDIHLTQAVSLLTLK